MSDKALKVVAERPAPVAPVPAGPPVVLAADRVAPGAAAAPYAAFLADLALHRGTETPLCIGAFGPAGVGKSSLLAATLNEVETLGRAAAAAGIATPFVAEPLTLRVLAEPGDDPYRGLLRQAAAGLAERDPALAAEAAQGFGDPEAQSRDAHDRLSTARHRLDEERRRLDDLAARQSRMVETVLFEGAGSRVDAYARANRGRIDRALRRFGFTGDTVLAYKELVRDAAEPGLGRGLGWFSAFWAYRGQLRLVVVALAMFVAAWLVGLLMGHQEALLEALRTSNDKMGPAADWLGAHAGWLEPVRQVLQLAGLAALAMNIVRALRFIQPVARGATLLRVDLDGRRRDLDGLLAHQAQRVEGLAREVEQASGRAAEAESRLAAAARRRPALPVAITAESGLAALARHFFATVSSQLQAGAASGGRTPARLIVTLDGFERVSPRAAAEFLTAAHLCLAQPGIVTLVAADRDQLAAGLAEADPALARAMLDRIVQVPLALTAVDEAPWPEARGIVQALLRPEAPRPPVEPEAGRSAFDKPWLAKESAVVEALAPFAGGTARALKRYVNLYRVARADPALEEAGMTEFAALALGLALGNGGGLPPSALLGGAPVITGDLQAARHAASTALGVALDLGRDNRGLAAARRYLPA